MYKKPILTLTIIIFILLTITACRLPFINITTGSGSLTSRTYDVSGFNAIQLDGAGELIITQGDKEALEIEAEDNIIDSLTVEVRNGTLVIGFTEKPWRNTIIPTRTTTYTLSVKELTQITINGAGSVKNASLETSSLAINFNGAGQAKLDDLSADSLSIRLLGTGTIAVSGKVASQVIEIDGAGDYQGADLMTESTTVSIDGLGNAIVWATENLDVTINGSGSVSYYGSPHVTQEISGLGDVNHRGDK